MKQPTTIPVVDDETRNRETLIHALRHKEVWPSGFHWHYMDLRTCAVGLADELGIDHWELGLNQEQFQDTFFGCYWTASQFVTPRRVANRLERYHRKIQRNNKG